MPVIHAWENSVRYFLLLYVKGQTPPDPQPARPLYTIEAVFEEKISDMYFSNVSHEYTVEIGALLFYVLFSAMLSSLLPSGGSCITVLTLESADWFIIVGTWRVGCSFFLSPTSLESE